MPDMVVLRDPETRGFKMLSEAAAVQLLEDINANGIGVVEGFLEPGSLESFRNYISTHVTKGQDEYRAMFGKDLLNSPIGKLANTPEFLSLTKQIYKMGVGDDPPKQLVFPVLRYLKGPTGLPHSFKFHYDSYVLTVLLPIFIPAQEDSGEFIMVNKRRRLRRSYLHNLLDKIVLNNRITQNFLKKAYQRGSDRMKKIPLTPGNAYFFWGYRTVHANAHCDPNLLRATALMHFGDPHAGSWLRKVTGRAKFRAEESDST